MTTTNTTVAAAIATLDAYARAEEDDFEETTREERHWMNVANVHAQGIVDHRALFFALDEPRHAVRVGEDGWVSAHPLSERMDGTLFDCAIMNDPAVLALIMTAARLRKFGDYWLTPTGDTDLWCLIAVDEPETADRPIDIEGP